MAIPLFGAMAHSGQLVSLDDRTVVKDLAALAGTGGNDYTPRLLSAPFGANEYGTLRRLLQSVPHEGAVTVAITPWRDGNETGDTISRPLTISDSPDVVAPMFATGNQFQVEVALSDFDAPAAIGAGELRVIPRRTQR